MKDYLGYDGTVAVVTGAASGIGEATTEMLVELGAKVYALDVVKVEVKGIERFIKTDLSDKDSIDAAFEGIPDEIDSFFGIAGVSGQSTDFDTTMKINYVANKYISEKYLSERVKEEGAVNFVTSAAGLGWEKEENKEEYLPIVETDGWEETVEAIEQLDFEERDGPNAYNFSKRVMNYYVSTLVAELGESKQIRVNAVLPAPTNSGLIDDFAKSASQFSGGQDGMEALSTTAGFAGRIAESKEIAGPLVFLNSDLASFVSGVHLDVDYGQNNQAKAGVGDASELSALVQNTQFLEVNNELTEENLTLT